MKREIKTVSATAGRIDADTAGREAAEAASLTYTNDARPGIRRIRAGRGFIYRDSNGKRIREPAILERIQALVIPPAWTDVWICPSASGHLQATGRDDRGRKQYKYHSRWRKTRDETKFERLAMFGATLPRIRRAVNRDLRSKELSRSKVLAMVIRLLETTLIRVGNEEYAQTNGSFGLTTLKNRHVTIQGNTMRFRFRGKSGKDHVVDFTNHRMAQLVKRCKDLPGHDLFEYLDDDGKAHSVTSAEVNDYLREISGKDFTAKDFRTWAGTLLATEFIGDQSDRIPVTKLVKWVAERLGNTPAVCRKCYIHPMILEGVVNGTFDHLQRIRNRTLTSKVPRGLREGEATLLQLLKLAR